MRKKILWGLLLPLSLWLPAKAQTWDQVIKTVASDRGTGDGFGYVIDISGNYAIVGALYEDEDENGNNTAFGAGSAYIFERNGSGTWNQVQKIVASDRSANDNFGWSVSISNDYAIVATPNEDEDENGGNTASGAGSAYIFERDGSGNWNEIQKIVASDRATADQFGWSVSISNNYVVVGAPTEDEDENGGNTASGAGSTYIFERDGGGNWNEIQKITSSDRSSFDQLGYTVSISGDYLIVGAIGEDQDENGLNTMSSAGAVYVFEKDGNGDWNQEQKIVASDRATTDIFGISLDLSGGYAIIGSYPEDEDENGSNTASESGSAYIFERNGGGIWSEVQKIVASDRAAFDFFGWSVSISGNYAIVGAIGEDHDENGSNTVSASGSSYIFERDGGGTWSEIQKIVASDRAASDIFGVSVAISGYYTFCGASDEDEDASGSNTISNAGSSYFFELKCNEITVQPSNEIICNGDNTSFSVTATGTSLTYQWQEDSGSGFGNISNGGVYSGATTATLTITAAPTSMDDNEYRCVVSASCGSDTYSDEVTLDVSTPSPNYGPGGVGNSTTNKVWLDASSLSLSDGSTVSSWADKSGNSLSASSSGSNRPIYRVNQLNGFPAIDFDGTNDYIHIANTPGINIHDISWFIVGNYNDYNATQAMLHFSHSGSSYNNNLRYTLYHLSTNKIFSSMLNTSGGGSISQHTLSNNTQIYSTIIAPTTVTSFTDGGQTGTFTSSTLVSPVNSNNYVTVGRRASLNDAYLDGNVSEVIVYNYTLTSVERIIVENYLSSKYNLTISNDKFAYEGTGHFYHVSGIGMESSNSVSDADGGSGVRISSPSSLANDDYLLWGHNNASTSPTTTGTPSAYGGTGEMITRIWRVDKTNDVGTVTVSFLLDGIATDSDLELLVDSDGNFSNATRITSGYSYDAGCDIATWTGVSFSDGDYFTVGSPDGTALFQIPITEFENSEPEENSTENTLEVLNNFNQQVELKLYPNPTTGILKIENKIENASISVFNTVGQLVYTGQINTGANSIDFSYLNNGIYFIEVNDLNKNSVLKSQFVILK